MNHMVITSYVSLIGKKRKSLSSVVDSSNQRLHSSSWGAVTDAAEPIFLFKGFPLQRRKERWWDLWALRRHAKVSGTTPQQLVVFPCPLGSGLLIQRLHAVCRPAMQCCSSYIQWLKKKKSPKEEGSASVIKVDGHHNVLCSPVCYCSDPFCFYTFPEFWPLSKNFTLLSFSSPANSPTLFVSSALLSLLLPMADFWAHWHMLFIFVLFHAWWCYLLWPCVQPSSTSDQRSSKELN